MSDPTIPILKRVKEVFESKREAIDAVITHVTQTIALLEDHDEPAPKAALPAHEPKERKIRKVKAEKSRPAVKARANARPYTQDDVLKIAVDLIRANGPQPIRAITEAVRAKFAKSKLSVSTALNQNAVKKKGARVEKTADGLWKIISPAKQGKVTHTPEEAEKLLEQARRNRENEITDQVRV